MTSAFFASYSYANACPLASIQTYLQSTGFGRILVQGLSYERGSSFQIRRDCFESSLSNRCRSHWGPIASSELVLRVPTLQSCRIRRNSHRHLAIPDLRSGTRSADCCGFHSPRYCPTRNRHPECTSDSFLESNGRNGRAG